ncbi:flagellar basal body P-ring protein FlgI [Litoribacillus peritrichatus]|uniref:Flagellar P-ring protein n=1 Tax=Litoribacillus peritrichatus TaxID=718191 RepID=A0ABP7M4N5_9GAMM
MNVAGMIKTIFIQSFCLVMCLLSIEAYAERLKDITSVAGVRSNQLVGYGLVVGLDGSGDKAPFTDQTFKNMMSQFGITIPPGTNPKLKNVAAVAIHAELPAFSKPGQNIDITVSSIGNATSLRGGTLLMTPLKGADGQVYAVAQGSMVVGGFGVEGADGSQLTVNVPSVGRIPNGAIVERAVPTSFNQGDSLVFNLNSSDFTTAKRVVDRVNQLLGDGIASAIDSTSIRVTAPRDPSQRVSFMSILENLEVDPGEDKAKVVINSRTGTIVVGQHVKVDPVAITHGSLTVSINENLDVDQPNAFGRGETVVTPRTELNAQEAINPMFMFEGSTSLQEIVTAVNQVGASPSDLIAILEAMKKAGALKAELIVL